MEEARRCAHLLVMVLVMKFNGDEKLLDAKAAVGGSSGMRGGGSDVSLGFATSAVAMGPSAAKPQPWNCYKPPANLALCVQQAAQCVLCIWNAL